MGIGEKLFATAESYQVFETLYNGDLSWGTAFFTVHGDRRAVELSALLCEDPDVIAVFRHKVKDSESSFNLWAVTQDANKAHEIYERYNR